MNELQANSKGLMREAEVGLKQERKSLTLNMPPVLEEGGAGGGGGGGVHFSMGAACASDVPSSHRRTRFGQKLFSRSGTGAEMC